MSAVRICQDTTSTIRWWAIRYSQAWVLSGRRDRARIGDVGDEGSALAPRRLDVGNGVRTIDQIQDGDRGALGRQPDRIRAADPAGRSGDHRDLALEPAGHADTSCVWMASLRIAARVAATALR